VDFFVVDLDEAAPDEMRLCVIFCDGHYLAESSRNNSFTFFTLVASHHRVCLTATGLPIRKDGPIVAVEDAIDEREGALFVDEALGAIGSEDIVEGKAFGLFSVILAEKIDLVVLRIDLYNAGAL